MVSVNLALHGTAEQSSTSNRYFNTVTPFYWNASLAVDGRKDQNSRVNLNSTPSCSKTNAEEAPWWIIDLHTVRRISSVTIYSRLDIAAAGVGVGKLHTVFTLNILEFKVIINILMFIDVWKSSGHEQSKWTPKGFI